MENSDSESDNDIKNENQPEEIDVTPEERVSITTPAHYRYCHYNITKYL